MERAVIVVKGEVQGVNYRKNVQGIARRLGVTGFVENLPGYDVRIVAEARKGVLDAFINEIRIKRPPVDVEHIDASFERPSGEYAYFEIKRGDIVDELGERIETAGSVMYEIRDLQKESSSVMHEMRDLQKESLKKQDETIEKIDSGNRMLGEKIDSGNKLLGGKIDGVSSKIDSGNRMLGDKMDSVAERLEVFHSDTIGRFDVVDEKYGRISDNMEKLMEKMDRSLDLMASQQERSTASVEKLCSAILKLAEKRA
ncbi:MAG: acylphosphatase [Candidatus Altiarchaeota archaeon]|nr:acylphosphatase [Candidatus Altiarchaeota archaeon]